MSNENFIAEVKTPEQLEAEAEAMTSDLRGDNFAPPKPAPTTS